MARLWSLISILVLLTVSIGAVATEAPQARKSPTTIETHGHARVDEYYWLNERGNPEVISYLEDENNYTAEVMTSTQDLQDQLYEEIVGRMDPADESVPVFERGYWYYSRYEPGGDYEVYCRKKGTLEAREEVMLDGNALADGHDFFSIRARRVSSDNTLIAYAVDTVGRRKYTIRFKNLETGQILEDRVEDVTGNVVWAEGAEVVFYTRQDPQTLRSFQIWRHVLGEPTDGDVLVYQEDDVTYGVSVSKSKSRKYLIIESDQTLATESRIIAASDPFGEWRVFEPRERGHEYSIDHAGDRFLIRTNWEAENYRLMACPESNTARADWIDVIPHREAVLFEGFEAFAQHLVLREREDGLQKLRVLPNEGEGYEIEFDDPTYSTWIDANPEFDTHTLRFGYSSLTTPSSVYDFDLVEKTRELMKRDKVIGDFDPSRYESQYLWAEATDGTAVPISLVYRKDLHEPGKNPLLLYAYGSYGYSSRASFWSPGLSLVDRGFVYAIAHVRGGQEMGRQWYEHGKLLEKKNTFTDFVDCAKFLGSEKWCDPDRVYALGGSAGGLLVGAVINLAPDVFHGAVARVPFVDVVTTMLDESIPLTTSEFDEWGNPMDPAYYDYMLSYSPYDNVEAKDYPHLLVTTGLHDSQVQYFEPAKWVARLRAKKTDDNLLLLQTNMVAGHGGASGRLSRQRETAFYFAFMLMLAEQESR